MVFVVVMFVRICVYVCVSCRLSEMSEILHEKDKRQHERNLCVFGAMAGFPVVLGLSRRTHLGFSMTVSFVHLFLVFLCSFSSLSICVHAFLCVCVCVCVCVCPCVCVCACAACTLFGAFDPFTRKSLSVFPVAAARE